MFVILFALFFPNVEIVVSGGFAWFTLFLAWLFGVGLIWIGVMGGSMTFDSKGLRGWIKDWKGKSKD